MIRQRILRKVPVGGESMESSRAFLAEQVMRLTAFTLVYAPVHVSACIDDRAYILYTYSTRNCNQDIPPCLQSQTPSHSSPWSPPCLCSHGRALFETLEASQQYDPRKASVRYFSANPFNGTDMRLPNQSDTTKHKRF